MIYPVSLHHVFSDTFYIYFQGKFVAAFAQSNLGDVSPNTKGAKCIDTGLPCDRNSSTCDGKVGNK